MLRGVVPQSNHPLVLKTQLTRGRPSQHVAKTRIPAVPLRRGTTSEVLRDTIASVRWADDTLNLGPVAIRLHSNTLRLAVFASWTTFLVVSVVGGIVFVGVGWTNPMGDPWNYLAAGERLNDGHPLYALSPGDRAVFLRPPYWSVPLLSPPPIAVAWRPLALLGTPAMVLWGALGLVGILSSVAYLIAHGRLVVVALLAASLTLTALSGNFSALLLPGLILIWLHRDRPWIVGLILAIAVAVKLTPAALLIWLALSGRWRAVAATLAVGGVIVIVSFVGAGPASFEAWLQAVPDSTPSPLSLSGSTGLPPALVAVLLLVPILVTRRHEAWGFRAAIVATALATPALYFQAISLLAAAAIRDPGPARQHPGVATVKTGGPGQTPAPSGRVASVPREDGPSSSE